MTSQLTSVSPASSFPPPLPGCSHTGTRPLAAAAALPRPPSRGEALTADFAAHRGDSASPALPALPSPRQRQRRSSAATNPATTALVLPPLSPPLRRPGRPPAALNHYRLPRWLSSLFYQSSPLASLPSYPSNAALQPQPSCWVIAQPSCSNLFFTT